MEGIVVRKARGDDRDEVLSFCVGTFDWGDYIDEVFDGCLSFSDAGSAYVPEGGPLPTRSTGYWQPDHDLDLYESFDKPRYRWTGEGELNGVGYVGLSAPAQTIPAGSLVRLSLSHAFPPGGDPSGFWLQLSGWFAL